MASTQEPNNGHYSLALQFVLMNNINSIEALLIRYKQFIFIHYYVMVLIRNQQRTPFKC